MTVAQSEQMFKDKAFHDQFLAFGGPPIPLVRAQMLGGKPEAKLWQAPAAAQAVPGNATQPAAVPEKTAEPVPAT
jgi:hypothetical protein